MKEKLARLFETKRLIPVAIYSEIIGVAFLCVGLFIKVPWVMIMTMPVGVALLGLGWLAWAWFFFKNI